MGTEIYQDQLFTSDDNDSMKDIILVFVAACKSDRIGKMLRDRGGVRHVICSKINSELVDSTTCEFTKALYTQIFQGKSVCQAYHLAIEEVKKEKDDQHAARFQLMAPCGNSR